MLRTPASLSGYLTSTWAGLPAAASAQGQIVRVTDVGVSGAGILVISDGTRWAPLGAQLLARSAVAASVTGTTAETTLATVNVPAGLMGVNGGLSVASKWSFTNSANGKTLLARLAGSLAAASSQSTQASTRVQTMVRNRNSAASQLADLNVSRNSGVGDFASPLLTLTVDTSVAVALALTGQLTTAAETLTLEAYEAWITP